MDAARHGHHSDTLRIGWRSELIGRAGLICRGFCTTGIVSVTPRFCLSALAGGGVEKWKTPGVFQIPMPRLLRQDCPPRGRLARWACGWLRPLRSAAGSQNDLFRNVLLPRHAPAPLVPVSLTSPPAQNSPLTSASMAGGARDCYPDHLFYPAKATCQSTDGEAPPRRKATNGGRGTDARAHRHRRARISHGLR